MPSWPQRPRDDDAEDLLGPLPSRILAPSFLKAMTQSNVEEPHSCAPTFVEAQVLPGSRVFRLAVAPAKAFRSVLNFFSEKLPAHLGKVETGPQDSRPWRLCAHAFLDYVQCNVEVAVFAVSEAEAAVTLRMDGEADVVNFCRLVAAFSAHLHSAPTAPSDLGDFEMDLLKGEDQEAWRQRIGTAVEDALSAPWTEAGKSQADFAVQALARWATGAECHQVLVEILTCTRGMLLLSKTFLRSKEEPCPLSQLYPLAATLRHLATGCAAEAMLVLQNLIVDSIKGSVPIVANELIKASIALDKVADLVTDFDDCDVPYYPSTSTAVPEGSVSSFQQFSSSSWAASAMPR